VGRLGARVLPLGARALLKRVASGGLHTSSATTHARPFPARRLLPYDKWCVPACRRLAPPTAPLISASQRGRMAAFTQPALRDWRQEAERPATGPAGGGRLSPLSARPFTRARIGGAKPWGEDEAINPPEYVSKVCRASVGPPAPPAASEPYARDRWARGGGGELLRIFLSDGCNRSSEGRRGGEGAHVL